eukprot:5980822-Prymnesium_polylepis.1
MYFAHAELTLDHQRRRNPVSPIAMVDGDLRSLAWIACPHLTAATDDRHAAVLARLAADEKPERLELPEPCAGYVRIQPIVESLARQSTTLRLQNLPPQLSVLAREVLVRTMRLGIGQAAHVVDLCAVHVLGRAVCVAEGRERHTQTLL